jgi:hypothetical protein
MTLHKEHMSVKWNCKSCEASFDHPTFVIGHIVIEHMGGSGGFEEIQKYIRVIAWWSD